MFCPMVMQEICHNTEGAHRVTPSQEMSSFFCNVVIPLTLEAFHHHTFFLPVLRDTNTNMIQKRIRLISLPLFGSWEKNIREEQQHFCLHVPTELIPSTSLTKTLLYTEALKSGQFSLEFFSLFAYILNHFLFHIWSKKTNVMSWFLHDRMCLYQVYSLDQFWVSKKQSQPGFVVEVCFLPTYIIWKGLSQFCLSMILRTFCICLNIKTLSTSSLLKTCLVFFFLPVKS